MKEKIKKIFIGVAPIIILLFVINILWGLLYMQACDIPPKEELVNLSCEEQVEKIANSCRYVILKWKEVKPSQKDIEACKIYKEEK